RITVAATSSGAFAGQRVPSQRRQATVRGGSAPRSWFRMSSVIRWAASPSDCAGAGDVTEASFSTVTIAHLHSRRYTVRQAICTVDNTICSRFVQSAARNGPSGYARLLVINTLKTKEK